MIDPGTGRLLFRGLPVEIRGSGVRKTEPNGQRPLQGELTINGSKNSALPLMAAALLTMSERQDLGRSVGNADAAWTMLDLGRHIPGGAEHELLRQAGATVDDALFVIDLPDLGGAQKLRDASVEVSTLMEFEGE